MGKRVTERSAACATCGKTFARSDTLLRHEKSHHATEDRGPVHRVTNGTFRACSLCAQARSRCSGGMPCGRCKTRNLECAYPSKRRKGTDGEDDISSTFSMTDMSKQLNNESSKNQQQQQQYPVQFQEFVFAPSDPPYPNNGQAGTIRADATSQPSPLEQIQLQNSQAGGHQVDLSTTIPLTTAVPQQMPPIDTNLERANSIPQQISDTSHYAHTSVPMDYQPAFDSNVSFGDGAIYDESLNLNWIPLSVYPSPYGNIEHDFSFLWPSLSDTASMSNDLDRMTYNSNLGGTTGSAHGIKVRPTPRYQPPASISGLMESPASTGSDVVAAVGFSFENVDVPDGKKKQRRSPQVPTGFPQTKEIKTDFSFPDTSALSQQTSQLRCTPAKYAQVSATFQRLCVNSSRWKPFSTSDFPDIAPFNACIDLYFEHLHPTFPLIHAPTFESNASWIICLATAAIGSTFAAMPKCADLREAFQEFLRRSVLATADEHDGDFRNMHLAQARILALIGLAHSDREQLRSRAPRSHADIARWCLESSILQLTAPDEEVRSGEEITPQWIRWIQQESLRRVGYFIWYLDCALGYIGNARPLCNMDDARAPLPCPDALWNAGSAQEWVVRRNNTPAMPSLCAALEMMYNKKKVDPALSEISHILLIHALYSRTWEVGTHIKQPLSEWTATGNSKGFLNTPTKDNFWLPLYPLYANWRNSACDCLDVLHWQASAIMARHSGAEHHGVLHLHMARVILLTPFQEIQDLLFFLINHRVSDRSKASFYVHDGSYQPRNPAKLPQIRKITWRWLREDQHKARLAMIHAGSIFWHIRRFTKYSFFEPHAIYLASIVLWTYGSYKSAALERYAAEAHHKSHPTTRTQYIEPDPTNRSEQTQTEPGSDSNIQPTRVERAAQDYLDSKSNSSRSRSLRDPSISIADGTSHAAASEYSLANSSPAAPPLTQWSNDHTDPTITISPEEPPSPTSSTSSSAPKFIHLDRPCDDEIVQHFVRNGHNMSGHMSNVGDICQTPGKVLLEGAKILRTKLACWGVSREYHDILVRLAEMRGGGAKRGLGD